MKYSAFYAARLLLVTMAISLAFLVACNSDQKEEPSSTAESAPAVNDVKEEAETAVDQPAPSGRTALQSSEDGLDIVFSGGGAKSIAQIGALKELEEQGISYR